MTQDTQERAAAQKKCSEHTSARARECGRLYDYAYGKQYAGRPSFLDESVPLLRRAPWVVYPAPSMAAASFADLILGEGRFLGVTTHASEDDEAFDARLGLNEDESAAVDKVVRAAWKSGRMTTHLAAMLRKALTARTGCVVLQYKRGEPTLAVIDAQHATPVFEDDDPTNPVVSLEIRYPFIHEFKSPDGTKHAECRLYRRTIDAVADVVYEPVTVRDGHADETTVWTEKTRTEHGFGFCPVVWYRHASDCCDTGSIDGRAIHEDFCDEIDGLNFALSMRHRAAIMLGDPMIVETGVEKSYQQSPQGLIWIPEGGDDKRDPGYIGKGWGSYKTQGGSGTRKSPGQTWRYENPQSSVSILSLDAGALNPIKDDADDLLAIVAEGMSWVPVDPKQMQLGTAPSGRALEWLHRKQLSRCDSLREDFGRGAIVAVVSMLLRSFVALANAGRLASVRVPGVADAVRSLLRFMVPVVGSAVPEWIAPQMAVRWGTYFPTTEADQRLVSEQVRADLLAGIITKRTAVTRIKPFYSDINDPEEYVETLSAEVADVAHAGAALAAEPVPAEPPPSARPAPQAKAQPVKRQPAPMTRPALRRRTRPPVMATAA